MKYIEYDNQRDDMTHKAITPRVHSALESDIFQNGTYEHLVQYQS